MGRESLSSRNTYNVLIVLSEVLLRTFGKSSFVAVPSHIRTPNAHTLNKKQQHIHRWLVALSTLLIRLLVAFWILTFLSLGSLTHSDFVENRRSLTTSDAAHLNGSACSWRFKTHTHQNSLTNNKFALVAVSRPRKGNYCFVSSCRTSVSSVVLARRAYSLESDSAVASPKLYCK